MHKTHTEKLCDSTLIRAEHKCYQQALFFSKGYLERKWLDFPSSTNILGWKQTQLLKKKDYLNFHEDHSNSLDFPKKMFSHMYLNLYIKMNIVIFINSNPTGKLYVYSKGVALLELPSYSLRNGNRYAQPKWLPTHYGYQILPWIKHALICLQNKKTLSQYPKLPQSKTRKIRAVPYIFEWWQDNYNAGRVPERITKEGAPQTGKDGYNYKLSQRAPGAGFMSIPPPGPRSPTLSSQNIYPSFLDYFDRMEMSLKLFQTSN